MANEADERSDLNEQEKMIFDYLLGNDEIVAEIKRLVPLLPPPDHENDNLQIEQEWKLYIYYIMQTANKAFPGISSTEKGIAISSFCRFVARNIR